jgi:ankyrin repeat protein
MLIDAGADINIKVQSCGDSALDKVHSCGDSALEFAKKYGHTEIVELLEEALLKRNISA